jgi:RNA polymerase sigma factor (sigma-70 family)
MPSWQRHHEAMSPGPTIPDAADLVRHAEFLRRFARGLLRDRHAAEDVAQQAIVLALEKPGAPRRSLGGWLTGTVRNLARMTMREDRRRSDREHHARRPEAPPAPLEVAARMEMTRRIVDAVDALEERYRVVVVLRFHDDLQPREIAERLGIPGATVRTRLRRALAMLRDRLDEDHRGSRRSWCLALLPLAWPRGLEPQVTPPAIGGLLVKKIAIVLALLLLILLLGGGVVIFIGTADDPGKRTTGRSGATAESSPASPDSQPETTELHAGSAGADAQREPEDAPPDDIALIVVLGPDRRRLPGAKVELLRDGLGELPIQIPEVLAVGVSDENGCARFSVVPLREYYLRISHPDLCVAGDAICFGGERVEYMLSEGGALAGTVTDAKSGDPVAGATVCVFDWGDGGALAQWRTLTDARGRYRVRGMGPGKVNVRIWGPDHAPRTPSLAPAIAAGKETRADFVLDGGVRIAVRVVDADTREILPDVEVWFFLERVARGGGQDLRTSPLPIQMMPVDLVIRAPGHLEESCLVRTDLVRRPGDAIEVSMTRGLPVRGRLVGPDGRGLAGVGVSVFSAGPDSIRQSHREATTDRDGGFDVRAAHPGGKVMLKVDLPQAGWTWSDEVRVAPGAVEVRIPPIMVAPYLTVTGHIIDEAGHPVAHARLHASSAEDGRGLTSTALTDRKGRFCLRGLRPGRVKVILSRWPRWAHRYRTIEVTENVEFTWRLERGHDIAGRVEFDDGTPVTRIGVQVWGPDSAFMGFSTLDEEGRFRVRGLLPGDYAVQVAARPESRIDEVPAGSHDVLLVIPR